MLVLGRRVGEEIWIGDDIRVVVVDIRGNQARLGFDAPLEVSIRRSEVDDGRRSVYRTAGIPLAAVIDRQHQATT